MFVVSGRSFGVFSTALAVVVRFMWTIRTEKPITRYTAEGNADGLDDTVEDSVVAHDCALHECFRGPPPWG